MNNVGKPILISCFVLLILVFSTLVYFFYVRTYKNNYFSVDYDIDWKKESSDNFKLKNVNDSVIEIYGQYDKDNTDVNDIYLDLNNNFLKNNNDYKLVNASNTNVGKNYYEGYELLYESDDKQVLYIIVVKDNKIVNINYTSSSDVFDLDLEQFYNVLNTIEIGDSI